jgi:hypothetical protein
VSITPMEQGRRSRESLPMHWLGDSLGQNIDGINK